MDDRDIVGRLREDDRSQMSWQEIRRDRHEAAAEIERLRETNTRLNRRCQQYESAVAEKVQTHPDGSLGRALANAEATRLRAEIERLQEALFATQEKLGEAEARLEATPPKAALTE